MIKKRVKNLIKGLIRKTGLCRNFEAERNNLENAVNQLKNEKQNLTRIINNLKSEKQNLRHLVDNLKAEDKSVKKAYLERDNLKHIQPDYNKLTVIIPYRKTDDPEREVNVDITLSYLSKVGVNNLIISEHSDFSAKDVFINKYGNLFDSFRVIFNKADGTLFNKAHAINKGVMVSETPYFAIFDVDCLVEKKNIDMALYLLDAGFEIVHPFNRNIKDIVHKEKFRIEYDFQGVESPVQYRDWADGGIVLWNKASFISIGMGNEYFSGWGGEDNEILIRANICHLKQIRLEDVLYHLYHERPQIRTQNNIENFQKIEKIKDKEELMVEISKWPWVIEAKIEFSDLNQKDPL
jgi:poly(ribitol-phosphate) beta-N-acetylglucosaminyltransferase